MTRVIVAWTVSPSRSSRTARAQGSSASCLIDSEMRWRSRSMPTTFTRTGSPALWSVVGSTPLSHVISERWTSPSATPTSTKTPKVVTLATIPSSTSPSASCPAAIRLDHGRLDHLAALHELAHARPLAPVPRAPKRKDDASVRAFRLQDGGDDMLARRERDAFGGSLARG